MGSVSYKMSAFDTGDGKVKRWTVPNRPDPRAIFAPTPVGSYTRIRVENVQPLTTLYEPFIHRWNERDTSQFEQVLGNGFGGVGTAGDWSLDFDTSFSDAPMLRITNNVAKGGAIPTADAIWLFNDFFDGLPERFYSGFRIATVTANAAYIGVIFYYEDTEHYMGARRIVSSPLFNIFGRNNGANFGEHVIMKPADTDADRDTVNGDIYGVTGWYQRASRLQSPAMTLRGGGEFDGTYTATGAVLQRLDVGAHTFAEANASWLARSSYQPRIGIHVRGNGAAGSNYIGGLAFFRAYGGL